jgi:2-dehydro-3-deoxyphosphogluconate aldolase/(4S)-4-hydroxy-2-oxoglutarate aldolase
MKTLNEILSTGPVVPALVFEDVAEGEAACHALYAGGIKVMKVMLSSDIALKVVEAVIRIADDIVIGVDNITQIEQCEMAIRAGAQFGASSGTTPALLEAAHDAKLPFLPGVMTPSDILMASSAGYTTVKFFPAQSAGGVTMLNAFHNSFPAIKFFPTGGITSQNAPHFLALPYVTCVGGSWLVSKCLLAQKNWKEITHLARSASQLGHHHC